jgi:hypothetical protein
MISPAFAYLCVSISTMHEMVAIFLETADGAYLIPSIKGELFPSAIGYLNTGESYIEASARKLTEETGLKAKTTAFRSLGAVWLDGSRTEVFLVKYNVSLGPTVFKEEQDDELWLDINELKEICLNEPKRISLPLKIILDGLL